MIQEITSIITREIAIRKTEEIIDKEVEKGSSVRKLIGTIQTMLKKHIKTKNLIERGTTRSKIKINRPKTRLNKVKNARMSMMMRKLKPMIKGLIIRGITSVEAGAAKIRPTTMSMFRKILTKLRMAVLNIKKRPKTTMRKPLRHPIE